MGRRGATSNPDASLNPSLNPSCNLNLAPDPAPVLNPNTATPYIHPGAQNARLAVVVLFAVGAEFLLSGVGLIDFSAKRKY